MFKKSLNEVGIPMYSYSLLRFRKNCYENKDYYMAHALCIPTPTECYTDH